MLQAQAGREKTARGSAALEVIAEERKYIQSKEHDQVYTLHELQFFFTLAEMSNNLHHSARLPTPTRLPICLRAWLPEGRQQRVNDNDCVREGATRQTRSNQFTVVTIYLYSA